MKYILEATYSKHEPSHERQWRNRCGWTDNELSLTGIRVSRVVLKIRSSCVVETTARCSMTMLVIAAQTASLKVRRSFTLEIFTAAVVESMYKFDPENPEYTGGGKSQPIDKIRLASWNTGLVTSTCMALIR